GHQVRVVPTESALRFVGAPTWEALSGLPVHHDVFTDVPEVPHVRLGQAADLILVAPATADLLAPAAHGRADDLLCPTLLTVPGPPVLAGRRAVSSVPAMPPGRGAPPAPRHRGATLRARGAVVALPASGRLPGADAGPGRLPEPAEIVELATLLLHRPEALPT